MLNSAYRVSVKYLTNSILTELIVCGRRSLRNILSALFPSLQRENIAVAHVAFLHLSLNFLFITTITLAVNSDDDSN